ncbi:MAG: signal peptidase I [Clostridiales bacterium]|nr:signal peptidase I [Clostridiales bacterium]
MSDEFELDSLLDGFSSSEETEDTAAPPPPPPDKEPPRRKAEFKPKKRQVRKPILPGFSKAEELQAPPDQSASETPAVNPEDAGAAIPPTAEQLLEEVLEETQPQTETYRTPLEPVRPRSSYDEEPEEEAQPEPWKPSREDSISDADILPSESFYSEEEESPDGEAQALSKEAHTKAIIKEVVYFVIPILLAFLVSIGLRAFVFANAVIPTESMKPTINANDRVIASKLSYLNSTPERFDVIIFQYPDDPDEHFVKRVIGLPGEKVEIIDGKVYIDDNPTPLDDSYAIEDTPTGNYGPYYVPEGSYFVLGDNRENSRDSRYWSNQFVTDDLIVGRVVFKYYPSFERVN